MEQREYCRIVVDIPGTFFFQFEDQTCIEVCGVLHDISESGIQVRFSCEDYSDLTKRLVTGDVVQFQAIDEYSVFNDNREDIIDGVGEVMWIDTNKQEVIFGCKANNVMPEYLSYVKHKKLSLYISGEQGMEVFG